jgi:hypothetical protein
MSGHVAQLPKTENINIIVFCVVFNDDEAVETVHDCQSTDSTRLTSLGHCFSNFFLFSVEEPLK